MRNDSHTQKSQQQQQQQRESPNGEQFSCCCCEKLASFSMLIFSIFKFFISLASCIFQFNDHASSTGAG
jgi:hypothetical protein